jgi:hypothetical protein
MALSTVSAVFKRIGLGKLSRLDPLEAPNLAGELLHVDVNKLGVITGAGTASPVAAQARTPTAALAGPERRRAGSSCTSASMTLPAWLRRGPHRREGDQRRRVLRRAVAFYAAHGISLQRVMTDG